MARGWESKAVEAQIEEHEARRPPVENPGGVDVERTQRRRTLELSRRRMLDELGVARTAAHREAVQQAIAFLDDELRKLNA